MGTVLLKPTSDFGNDECRKQSGIKRRAGIDDAARPTGASRRPCDPNQDSIRLHARRAFLSTVPGECGRRDCSDHAYVDLLLTCESQSGNDASAQVDQRSIWPGHSCERIEHVGSVGEEREKIPARVRGSGMRAYHCCCRFCVGQSIKDPQGSTGDRGLDVNNSIYGTYVKRISTAFNKPF